MHRVIFQVLTLGLKYAAQKPEPKYQLQPASIQYYGSWATEHGLQRAA